MVEKQAIDKVPSDMVVLERYVLMFKIFELLEIQGKSSWWRNLVN